MIGRTVKSILACLSAFTLSTAAHAQESTAYGNSEYGGGWASPSFEVSQSIIRDVVNRQMIDDVVLGKNRSNASDSSDSATRRPSAQIAPAVAEARLGFVMSVQGRSRNYSQFIARSRTSNPGAATFYDQMLTSNLYMAQLDNSLAAKGLKSNNIADAFATYWMSTWLASRGRPSTVSPTQAEATRAMAIQILSNTPSLATMKPDAKQEIADELFIKAGLLDGLMALTASDPGARKTIAQVARQGAQRWNLDLDAMTLGPNGFSFGPVRLQ